MHYIFIDYENVQPKSLSGLNGKPCKIYVFVGAAQSKLSFDLAAALQKMGSNAIYIKLSESKANALDFHIAFYMGELSAADKAASFHIISKDTGYDPLIKHLKARKIKVERVPTVSDMSLFRVPNGMNFEGKIATITDNLRGRGQSRPRKLDTLANTINSLFTKKLKSTEISNLINHLKNKEIITVDADKVSYNFSKTQKPA